MWKRLAAFVRVPLRAGAQAIATMHVSADDLATFDENMRLRVEAGRFTITVGNSSAFDLQAVDVDIAPSLAAAATECLRNVYRI
jgi:hypothetical protein